MYLINQNKNVIVLQTFELDNSNLLPKDVYSSPNLSMTRSQTAYKRKICQIITISDRGQH